ncbi:MAG: NADP(H)-dependent aldo-keto reductase [Oceanospirillaceae bacterium]|nr:NADP(H)-dependent aldo-keto reductase [Oceanospirillaceae bacterium]|tara:strand:+ start:2018 stop:3052 length:1035 start_codon:yes stop_codon:yes gene_type:complete
MQQRPLGRSGLNVSKLCLGTMTWGEQNSEAEAHRQLDMAVAYGINFIDTAEMYPVPPKAETQGLTETYLGSWLAARGKRDDLIIASKVAGPGNGLTYLRDGPELTAAHVHQALDESLQRLQTDYLDLYQIHWPSRSTNFFGRLGYVHQEEESTPLEETLGALQEEIQKGRIRHYGLSNETPWGTMKVLALAEKMGLPAPVSIQNPYNLLNRTYEVGMAEVSHRENCGLLAYSPLAFGVLTGKYLHGQRPEHGRITLYSRFTRYTSDLAEKAAAQYVALAKDSGMTPAQLALAFVTQQAFVTSNIIGATTEEQLEENLKSSEVVLSEEILAEIEAIHKRIPNPCP